MYWEWVVAARWLTCTLLSRALLADILLNTKYINAYDLHKVLSNGEVWNISANRVFDLTAWQENKPVLELETETVVENIVRSSKILAFIYNNEHWHVVKSSRVLGVEGNRQVKLRVVTYRRQLRRLSHTPLLTSETRYPQYSILDILDTLSFSAIIVHVIDVFCLASVLI